LRRRLSRLAANRELLSALGEGIGNATFDAVVEEMAQRLERGHLTAFDLDGNNLKPSRWGELTPDSLLSVPPECRFEAKAIRRLWPEPGYKTRRGRKPGSGTLAAEDEDLIRQMLMLVREGFSAWRAADRFAAKAAGHGTHQSKQMRLYRRFRAAYPEESKAN
jgi:hypothetical protein